MGIWGVTDCPLKYEVKEQYDDWNALLIDDLDNTGGEPEQSYKNRQPTAIYDNVNTEAGISHAQDQKLIQAWPPTNTMRIHDNNDQ